MKRAARTDENQAAIVAALRAVGAEVQPLHAVGRGCPDLLVSHRGANWLIEVKQPARDCRACSGRGCGRCEGRGKVGGGKLTPDQERWHARWRGQVAVVSSADEAIAAIGVRVHSPGKATQ